MKLNQQGGFELGDTVRIKHYNMVGEIKHIARSIGFAIIECNQITLMVCPLKLLVAVDIKNRREP